MQINILSKLYNILPWDSIHSILNNDKAKKKQEQIKSYFQESYVLY